MSINDDDEIVRRYSLKPPKQRGTIHEVRIVVVMVGGDEFRPCQPSTSQPRNLSYCCVSNYRLAIDQIRRLYHNESLIQDKSD